MDIIKYNKNVQRTQENSRLTADVYFLIQRFLSNGPLKRTLQTLNEELDQHQILPKRLDWQGNQHEQSIEDMQRQFPYIHKDFLYYLCSQASTHLNPNHAPVSFLSFRPKDKNKDGILSNYKQYFNYVTRLHGAPVNDIKSSCNIVNSIRGREVGGALSRTRTITPKIYNGMQMQRLTIGHLSAVYCLLFDHSGRYVITGADDLLIKLWSTYTGRLIATFRGASSEITDIAVDPDNILLAAGSIDKHLRVWNLQSGAPAAVLIGHNGMITSVNFCPTSCWGHKYLISTSSDGSIAFWTYSCNGPGDVEFKNTPNLYQEKLRPGQAQMICSSFSPGGTFLATGSADHHVRVYYMKADEGPQRILETEAHIDRVDSIQWAHSGLKFLSGSKDGNAIIWWFERQQWKNVHLAMTTKLPNEIQNTEPDSKNKIRVTMVAWNRSDSWVITAVSDHTLKVWSASSGQLVRILKGHTDEAYVLEPHPHDEDVILSAGHDGQLLIWDIHKGEILFRYLNNIEGQGYGAIFDAKWSPDGCNISASDSHGDILTFGFGTGSPFYKQLPKELFFHTDYRPLVRDDDYWVLDEQTQVPPQLLPPPFLVDIDGNPYPPMLQRLVPGRENCRVDQLVPNMWIGNEGMQEVINHFPDDEEDEDVRGNAGGSVRNHRIRQSTGDWQTDHNIEWKQIILMKPISSSVLARAREIRKQIEHAEMNEYQKQLKRRPLMISTAGPSNLKDKKKRNVRGKKKELPQLPKGIDLEKYDIASVFEIFPADTDESSFSDWAEEVSEAKKRRSYRRKPKLPSHRSSSDDDDDDTDLTEDTIQTDSDDSHRERSGRKSRNHRAARRKTRKSSPRASVPKNPVVSKKDPIPKTAQTAKHTAAEPSTSGEASTSKGPKIKISEQYKLSEWLSETRPRKSPYYPQIHDEIVYFIQGHLLYVEAVKLKNVYEPNIKEFPWVKGMQLKDHEFCKVVGIRYEIKPPRLCCLKLALQDETGRPTGKGFTIRFHDMPDVLDFFVLKQSYLTAMSRDWQNGERFRCMIDDNWWMGVISGKSPASDLYPESAFMCYEICWTNGEQERMSPWDMEPVDESRIPEDEKEALPVLECELRSILYKAVADDWPNCERDTACKAIARGITQVMELAIAEPFLVPVDINVYPTYALIVEYPIDLSTIKARFENNFYRRMSAAQFDISYLETNAAKFNEQRSVIVKHAKILAELCLRIVKSCNDDIDIAAVYHQLVAGYDSSDTEEEVEVEDISKPSTSRAGRYLPVRSWKSPEDWKIEASGLVELMMQSEDSVPFRFPVNKHKYPTYLQIIETPMDLGTVKENLQKGAYYEPSEFCTDIRLIFQNSRTFNTNKRSRIHVMTVRLSAMFEEHMSKIMSNWSTAKERQRRHRGASSDDSTSSSSSSSEPNEPIIKSPPKQESPKVIVQRIDNGLYNGEAQSDSDSDNTPLGVIKAMNTSNTAGYDYVNYTLEKVVHDDASWCERLNENGSAEESEPQPSTSSQSQVEVEYFDHNYTNRKLPTTPKDPPDEDTDTDQPSSSSRSRRLMKNNNYKEKSSDDETYKRPAPRKFELRDEQSPFDKVESEIELPNSIETSSDDSDEDDPLSALQARQLQMQEKMRKKKTSSDDENDEDFCPEDSSGSSRSKIIRRRKKSNSSDDEFEVTNRKSKRFGGARRKRKSSFVVEEDDDDGSSNVSSEESSDDDVPLRNARLRRNPKKNKNYQSTESDSDTGRPDRKRRKLISGSQVDSDSEGRSRNGRPGYFGNVSSRGRLRKITERAAAFLKKDKKAG